MRWPKCRLTISPLDTKIDQNHQEYNDHQTQTKTEQIQNRHATTVNTPDTACESVGNWHGLKSNPGTQGAGMSEIRAARLFLTPRNRPCQTNKITRGSRHHSGSISRENRRCVRAGAARSRSAARSCLCSLYCNYL